jgi:hypothetical protein
VPSAAWRMAIAARRPQRPQTRWGRRLRSEQAPHSFAPPRAPVRASCAVLPQRSQSPVGRARRARPRRHPSPVPGAVRRGWTALRHRPVDPRGHRLRRDRPRPLTRARGSIRSQHVRLLRRPDAVLDRRVAEHLGSLRHRRQRRRPHLRLRPRRSSGGWLPGGQRDHSVCGDGGVAAGRRAPAVALGQPRALATGHPSVWRRGHGAPVAQPHKRRAELFAGAGDRAVSRQPLPVVAAARAGRARRRPAARLRSRDIVVVLDYQQRARGHDR